MRVLRPARVALVGALVAAALAAAPGTVAQAAEVRLDRIGWGKYSGPAPGYWERLSVRDKRGEANRIELASGSAGELQITDVGARLQAGPGCTATGRHRVACSPTSPYLVAFVLAGDGDDLVSSSVAARVDGGNGDDRLSGSRFGDMLYGGEGRDVLGGRSGDDLLQDARLRTIKTNYWFDRYDPAASPPNHPIAPVRAERDAFDGGPGVDLLTYQGRRARVFADLARRAHHAGARGEHDLLRGLEGVAGGSGDDRLLGDDAMNSLYGGAGNDVADGRAGDDRIDLGVGSNRARGGTGDDTIAVAWGETPQPLPQRVACGRGRDRVSQLFRNDFAADDCETIVIAEFHELQALLPPGTLERPPLASYSTTPVDCEAPSCRLALDARIARSPSRRAPGLKGMILGKAEATIPNRGLTTLTLQLSDQGSLLLRRYRRLLIRIHLKIVRSDAQGFLGEGAYLTHLRAP